MRDRGLTVGCAVPLTRGRSEASALATYLNGAESVSPSAFHCDVVSDVAGAADPADVEGLVVVVVVTVGALGPTLLAGLAVGVRSPGCCSGEDSASIFWVVGVAGLPLGLDPLGVALVEGEPVCDAVSGCSEVTAPPRAESPNCLGGLELSAAVLAVSHDSILPPLPVKADVSPLS